MKYMEDNKDFEWHEPRGLIKDIKPITGEIAIVNIPVQVLFEWSDKIVADVDENDNPVEYKEGYIMKVLPNQSFVYNDIPFITVAHTFKEE